MFSWSTTRTIPRSLKTSPGVSRHSSRCPLTSFSVRTAGSSIWLANTKDSGARRTRTSILRATKPGSTTWRRTTTRCLRSRRDRSKVKGQWSKARAKVLGVKSQARSGGADLYLRLSPFTYALVFDFAFALCPLPFDFPRFDDHRHPEARAERDERPRLDQVPWNQLQPIPLRQRSDAELRFDERELIADTLTRPGAERYVDELRAVGAALW